MEQRNAGIVAGSWSSAASLVAILQGRAIHQPQRLAYRFLPDEVGITPAAGLGWSYGELHRRVGAIATQLAEFTHQPVMLAFPAGLDFVAAFLGCLQAGAIAVPVPLPGRHQGLERWQHIVADVQPRAIMTTAQQLSQVRSLVATMADQLARPIPCLAPQDDETNRPSQPSLEPAIAPDDIALLQYTSGSTSQPRGVMVSHGNLIHNLALIHERFGHSPDSHGVIWLPPHHDMGLIGGVLQPLYGGFPVTLMSPGSFLRQPVRWLQTISAFGGTTSGGPNFAYERCLQRITPEQRQGLDLSTWDLAFTGAEPVRARTLEQFADAFAECGFRQEAFYPCYGLAEATLFVSGGSKLTPPETCSVDRTALAQGQVTDSPAKDALRLVSCGQAAADQSVLMVDPQTCQPCKAEQVGEIWLAGPSVAQGYWHQAETTQETFTAQLADGTGPLLRTGDLGFLRNGELFVTGRLKDVIIIRGQNHYPQDIEQTVAQSHAAVQAQAGAAFGLEMDGEERLIVMQEVKRTALRSLNSDVVIEAIRATVSGQHRLQLYGVALLKPGSLPKTTSGKVQRHACKTRFQDGSLDAVGEWSVDESDQAPQSSMLEVQSPPNLGNLGGQGRVPSSQSNSGLASVPKGDPARTDALVQWLRQYASDSINSRLMDERRCISPGVVLDFGNQGLLGMQVPTEYAGLGLGHQDMLRVLEQLGAIDPTLALFVGLNNVLGIRPILQSATPDFKADWLPRLATGRELAAFALTEPEAGSNPNAIQSRVVDVDGGWWLYGKKIWSGSAAWAGVINVFVQHPEASGISGFALSKGTPGLRQGPEALTMGMRGMVQNTVSLDRVPVSAAQLLGQPGGGMAVAQDAMMYGRLAIASACVGGMKRCAQLMLRYSARRTVGTGRLLDNPVTLTRLGGLTAQIETLSALVSWIAQQLDQGKAVLPEAYTACKILAPEFYWQATDDLVQGLGGRGYIETNLAPQMLRDARVLRIFEGPTETLAMHLGAQMLNPRSGLKPFLSQELGSPELAERLFAAAEDILARYQHRQEAVTARRWAYLVVGELGAIAILLAIQQSSKATAPRALEWTQRYFEQKLAQALVPTPHETVAAAANTTAEWINRYTDTIGDIEQSWAGEDHDLDDLLKRDDRRVHPRSHAPSPGLRKGPPAPNLGANGEIYVSQHVRGRVAHEGPPAPNFGGAGGSKSPRIRGFRGPESKGTRNGVTEERTQSLTAKSLEQWLGQWLAQHLSLPAADIDPAKAFADYGVDSVMAVELAQDLEEFLGLQQPLDATLAWNFPTISSLAAHLATHTSPQTLRRLGEATAEPNPQPLDDLSEADLADALAAELASLQGRGA